MFWLEFHVNQGGFKHHHWSTSSWFTAPPQPISQRGAVTSRLCTTLAADAQCCSLVQVKMDSLTVSCKTSFHTGDRYMCLPVTAVRLPGDPLTIDIFSL